MEDSQKGYGKRPLWQWVLIYLVIGAIVYGIIYYFFLSSPGPNPLGNIPPRGWDVSVSLFIPLRLVGVS